MPPRVVLVGLPGSGKSSAGSLLAGRLGIPFADSDDLIVEATGRSIPAIFAEDGEPAFRELESRVISRALAEFDGVLALGGGAVTTECVRQRLDDANVPVLQLTADEPELLLRLQSSPQRPLLAGDPAGRLAVLAVERAELYQAVATMTVSTAGKPLNQVVEELERILTEPDGAR